MFIKKNGETASKGTLYLIAEEELCRERMWVGEASRGREERREKNKRTFIGLTNVILTKL